MFSFNFNLSDIADWYDSGGAAKLEQELAALASVATAAAVASPAVVDSPKNTAPAVAEVQQVVTQVVQAVAPAIAPSVPQVFISKLEQIIPDEVVANPQVKASGAGTSVAPAVVNNIASSISSTFKNDAQKDAELNAAVKQVASSPSATLPATSDLVYRGGASVTPDLVYRGGATTVNLATTATTSVASASTTKTREERMDELKKEREDRLAAEAAERAKSNPMYDFQNRPAAPAADDNYIYYYSWIGGVGTGQWKLYRAPNTEANKASYGSRAVGGATQATANSAVGANALITQPQPIKDSNGNIVSWTKPSTTGAVTGGVTTGVTTGGVTTGVTTGGVTTGIVTSGVTTGGVTVGGTTTTDPAVLAMLESLKQQNAALMAMIGKQDAAAEQAKLDAAAAAEAAKKEKAENAIMVLTDRFNRYGLASLVPKIKELAIGGANESTITLELQETDEYKQRFRANQDRIKKGLSVLDPGDYLGLEDDYRQILRAYGLKQFDNDNYVTQFIANDISTTELSNRVVTAVQRVQNADPAVLTTLRSFYGISDNDLVAYVLDPNQQFPKIERQVAAAEIGSAAKLQGFNTGVAVAEQLAAQGVTKAQAQKGYATIADILPTAEKLSDIYGKSLDEYRLAEAEQEVFNTLASAQRKRQKLAEREVATFSGASGLSRASLSRQVGGTI